MTDVTDVSGDWNDWSIKLWCYWLRRLIKGDWCVSIRLVLYDSLVLDSKKGEGGIFERGAWQEGSFHGILKGWQVTK